ncbi:hypothetical protein BaRGS_00039790 [Batillaria attramentaria]|uniref:Uncharacterized protein n=1 Tax=Batillaria attramentaria TaxID=370345 RepID=A0ABD0J312_9CAEN
MRGHQNFLPGAMHEQSAKRRIGCKRLSAASVVLLTTVETYQAVPIARAPAETAFQAGERASSYMLHFLQSVYSI